MWLRGLPIIHHPQDSLLATELRNLLKEEVKAIEEQEAKQDEN